MTTPTPTLAHAGTPPVGPLTAIWTQPSFCTGYEAYDYYSSSSYCLPSNFPYLRPQTGLDQIYFSPAICPSGYTVACSRPTTSFDGSIPGGSKETKRLVAYGPALEPSETAQICCPSSYACYDPSFLCMSYGAAQTNTLGMDSTTYTAFAIQVRYQASDLAALETNPTVPGETSVPASATSGAAVTGSGGAAATTGSGSGSGSNTGNSGSGGGGLSTGAKAGIGVGVSVVVLVILLGAFCYCGGIRCIIPNRRIRKASEHGTQDPTGEEGGRGAPGDQWVETANEAPNTGLVELGEKCMPVELPGTGIVEVSGEEVREMEAKPPDAEAWIEASRKLEEK